MASAESSSLRRLRIPKLRKRVLPKANQAQFSFLEFRELRYFCTKLSFMVEKLKREIMMK